jgi:transcriptional regulator with XRE-family HTH domain
MRRLMLGMSQEKLGKALGLTFQQIQKYEKGASRIGVSQLQQIAHTLDVPITFFFKDLPKPSNDDGDPNNAFDFLATPNGLSIMKSFMSIKDRGLRRAIVVLMEHLASEGGD